MGSLFVYKGGHSDSLGLLASCGARGGAWGSPWAQGGRGTCPGHLRQCRVIAGIQVLLAPK